MNIWLTSFFLLLVVVKNHGSTTITYEWKKVQRGDHIASKKSDFLQRFFCHYVSKGAFGIDSLLTCHWFISLDASSSQGRAKRSHFRSAPTKLACSTKSGNCLRSPSCRTPCRCSSSAASPSKKTNIRTSATSSGRVLKASSSREMPRRRSTSSLTGLRRQSRSRSTLEKIAKFSPSSSKRWIRT